MATVYSNEVSVGSYNRIRIKLDYSGTSATATIQFRRTSSYSTTWSDNNATLTLNGTTKSASYSYSGTVGTNWIDLKSNITGFTVSTSGGTYNWTFTNSGGGVLGCSGTITVPAQAGPPSGLSVALSSRTWQSVNIQVSYSSLGSGSFRYTEAKIFTSDSTGYWGTEGVCKGRWEQYSSAAGAHTFTLDNSDNEEGGGIINIRGCTAFKIGGGIFTSDGDQHSILSTIYYTPPAPLQSITQSQVSSQTSNSVTHTITITGGNSTNNNTQNVSTWYRVSTDGGSTYTAWIQAGTGTPWTAKTASFTSTYGASIKVEARQAYQSLYSETKTLSYTATSATPPSGNTATATSTTWNSVTVNGSITSYGKPAIDGNKKIAIGISETQGTIAVKLENQLVDVLSGTTTITNDSIAPGATKIVLKGCKTVYPYLWAHNGVASSIWYGPASSAVTTAPYKPTLTVVEGTPSGSSTPFTINLSGSSNNESVTATYRYRVENNETEAVVIDWTDIGTASAGTSGSVSTNISLANGNTYLLRTRIIYNGQGSEFTEQILTVKDVSKFYGSAKIPNITAATPRSSNTNISAVDLNTFRTQYVASGGILSYNDEPLLAVRFVKLGEGNEAADLYGTFASGSQFLGISVKPSILVNSWGITLSDPDAVFIDYVDTVISSASQSKEVIAFYGSVPTVSYSYSGTIRPQAEQDITAFDSEVFSNNPNIKAISAILSYLECKGDAERGEWLDVYDTQNNIVFSFDWGEAALSDYGISYSKRYEKRCYVDLTPVVTTENKTKEIIKVYGSVNRQTKLLYSV